MMPRYIEGTWPPPYPADVGLGLLECPAKLVFPEPGLVPWPADVGLGLLECPADAVFPDWPGE